MCSSNMYDCCKWFPDLLSLNVEGSVSVLKYSAVVERISNCVYWAICFNIEYLQLNSWGTKRSYSPGFCIRQMAPYVKLCMFIKIWLHFVWSHKRGFLARVACQRWFWQARTAPEPAHLFLVSANFIYIWFTVKTKLDMHLANTAHIGNSLC